MKRALRRWWPAFLALPALTAALGACSEVRYLAQCAGGHVGVMLKCEPIDTVLARAETPAELREQLEFARAVRTFAIIELGLPENGSYTRYADLGRPYVVWNVVAAPEFSVEPVRWCFPVAGCVPYRGYYQEERARAFAEGLVASGHDVYLYGVRAYSTLQWFDDPVLNTFPFDDRPRFAEMIFHELAHQQLYVKDDTDFNEAFAEVVGREGVRRWLERHGSAAERERHAAARGREEQFVALLMTTRGHLAQLYGEPTDREAMRAAKAGLLESFRRDYLALRAAWGLAAHPDPWLESGLNNAKFASVSTYRRLVPAFEALLAEEEGDLARFYARAAALARLAPDERRALLEHRLPHAG